MFFSLISLVAVGVRPLATIASEAAAADDKALTAASTQPRDLAAMGWPRFHQGSIPFSDTGLDQFGGSILGTAAQRGATGFPRGWLERP
jgi:hypothetical protein